MSSRPGGIRHVGVFTAYLAVSSWICLILRPLGRNRLSCLLVPCVVVHPALYPIRRLRPARCHLVRGHPPCWRLRRAGCRYHVVHLIPWPLGQSCPSWLSLSWLLDNGSRLWRLSRLVVSVPWASLSCWMSSHSGGSRHVGVFILPWVSGPCVPSTMSSCVHLIPCPSGQSCLIVG